MNIENKLCEPFGMQNDGTYCNPILNADYSDPDIVRYNDKYYMITSTFNMYPGVGILESEDLVNWKTIGYAMYDLDKLDENFNWDKMDSYNYGIYACSLRYIKWNEKDKDGSYKERIKWFIHTTLFTKGIVVSTADDILGPWKSQYMKDKNGLDITAFGWDDNCPYWEFNEDGTIKAAYMIASKWNGAWYNHIFEMSHDGTVLLDADNRYMSLKGDTTRKRTGLTPQNELFSDLQSGDPLHGEIVSKNGYEIIKTCKNLDDTHNAQMDEWGNTKSVTQAIHYTDREGTVIDDIFSAEAAKIIRFDENTIIGNTTFSGRHGDHEKICDYVYIFNSEYWDGFRMPILRRAKSVYGDIFDENGVYIGPGTKGNPGSYEIQRININTYTPVMGYEPNQGGYIDIPPHMSTDGKEHWYWLTHHGEGGDNPQCRPVSLLPVTWIEGWPIAGQLIDENDYKCKGIADVLATPYDGTGIEGNKNNEIHHPNQRIKPGIMQWVCSMPPVKKINPSYKCQGSDYFGKPSKDGEQYSQKNKLSPNWQWNYKPRNGFWSLSDREGYLRLYAFSTVDKKDNIFKTGNVLCQKYIGSDTVICEIKMDCKSMKNGQEAGLVHFNGGVDFDCIGIKQDESGVKRLSYNHKVSEIIINTNTIIIKSTVNKDRINTYEYSVDDGKTFTQFGGNYLIKKGGYCGDLIGIYTFNNNERGLEKDYIPCENYPYGFVDIEYFKYIF